MSIQATLQTDHVLMKNWGLDQIGFTVVPTLIFDMTSKARALYLMNRCILENIFRLWIVVVDIVGIFPLLSEFVPEVVPGEYPVHFGAGC